MQLQINLPGYEQITLELDEQGTLLSYHLETSDLTLRCFEKMLRLKGKTIAHWDVKAINSLIDTEGQNFLNAKTTVSGARALASRRTRMLLSEMIERVRATWTLPFQGEIVCTCRQVSADVIDHSIVAGAQKLSEVSQWTTACTSCTSCRPKIEEMIAYRQRLLITE